MIDFEKMEMKGENSDTWYILHLPFYFQTFELLSLNVKRMLIETTTFLGIT